MRRAAASPGPIVLMYHGVTNSGVAHTLTARRFENQILFLKRACTFIGWEQYATTRSSFHRPAVLLTFDDGYRNNAEIVAPILRRHGVPAVFFISSRHCTPGKYLWFTYLRMLQACFPGQGVTLDGRYIALHGARREQGVHELARRLLSLQPHPAAMYMAIEEQLPPLESFVSADLLADECDGMSAQQIAELSADPLFTIGGHTVDHPRLTRCSPEQAWRQMADNQSWLQSVTGRRCELFAYPEADFNQSIVNLCQNLSFRQAYGTELRYRQHPQFAIPRIGIYSGSRLRLATKVWAMESLPIRFVRKSREFFRRIRTRNHDLIISPIEPREQEQVPAVDVLLERPHARSRT